MPVVNVNINVNANVYENVNVSNNVNGLTLFVENPDE